jgi:hypothetical protein
MKNFIIILLIFISLFSCKPEPYNAEIKYLISNASTHNIELTFFHTPDYKDTIFFIFPDSIIEYNSAIGGFADSAYLNFDNVKQIIYRLNDGMTRNILVEDNYMGGKVNDYLYQYVYEITEEDFENAIEIK